MFKALFLREIYNFRGEDESKKKIFINLVFILGIYFVLIKFTGIFAGIFYFYTILASMMGRIFTKENEVSALSYLSVTPVSRYKYIGVKFILLIGASILAFLLNSFNLYISYILGIYDNDLTFSVLAMLSLCMLVMVSINIPLTIKFGQNIAAISNLVITFIVVGLIIFIATALENLELTWLKSILSGVNEGTFKIILMIFLVFILFLNYLLSVKFSKYPKN